MPSSCPTLFLFFLFLFPCPLVSFCFSSFLFPCHALLLIAATMLEFSDEGTAPLMPVYESALR